MAGSNKSRFKPTATLKKQSAASRMLSLRHQLEFLAITDLNPGHRHPRKHDRAQIRAIAASIETFGFNAPILIDKSHRFSQGTAVRRQRRQSAVSFGRNHKKRERTAPTPENMFPGSSK
jgi:hypothetical protein